MEKITINNSFLIFILASTLSFVVIESLGLFLGGWNMALLYGEGALLALFNELSLGLLFWVAFYKKYIASSILLIVIKYSILIMIFVLGWPISNFIVFSCTMVGQLLLSALIWFGLVTLINRKFNGTAF